MYCRNCGKEIYGTNEYCEACQAELDNSVNNTPPQNQQSQQGGYNDGGNQKKKCCPRCKSRNLQIVTNTEYHSQTSGGGYSAGKGCCGYMALGPLGLLCGACGSKSKTTVTSSSTNVWVCRDCGNKFRDIADIEADIAKQKQQKTIFIILCVFMSIFSLLGAFIMHLAEDMPLSFMFLCFCVVFGLLIFVVNKNINNNILVLQEEIRNIEKNGYINE